jgi:hypothetical protein
LPWWRHGNSTSACVVVNAADFALVSAGAFLLTGLITGIWKYACIHANSEAKAPPYVDTAHRASLLYAFACALIAELCRRSAWPDGVNFGACLALVAFFAAAVLGYVVHGLLRDTDNQLRRPHRLGRMIVPPGLMVGFMLMLILTEIAGFLIVFSGFVAALG